MSKIRLWRTGSPPRQAEASGVGFLFSFDGRDVHPRTSENPADPIIIAIVALDS